MNQHTIPGEYYLEGMREMASGFLFREDGSFQFFFTYGAMDRFGSGQWKEEGGKLLLNSAPAPESDFTLIESDYDEAAGIAIRVESPNPALLSYIYCSLDKGAEGSWQQLSQRGELQIPRRDFDAISLILEFCPERFSTIAVSPNGHNRFQFRIEPSIMEVFFRDFSLMPGEGGLTGGHPLMTGEVFRYAKQ